MATLLYNGLIHTMDESCPRADAMLLVDGRVVALGAFSEVEKKAPPDAERVDLRGATVLPGFHDAHVHVWKVGQLRTHIADVRGVASIAELQDHLRAFAAAHPHHKWIVARGYNEATLSEGRHPDRRDLDAAVPDRPVWLIRTCAHVGIANSRALAMAGIDANTPDIAGGEIIRDARGGCTGRFTETALGLVARHLPSPSQQDYEAMILEGQRVLLSLGITSATDPAVHPELLEAYIALDRSKQLEMRFHLLAIRRPDGGNETFPLPPRHESANLRVLGVKFFADGGLSGATAALRVPYRHADTRGVLRFDTAELLALAREAHDAGFAIGTHAIGDAALDQVLDVYERLGDSPSGARHRIEHFGLPDAGHLSRMRACGGVAVPQAIFLRELGGNFRRYLPDALLGQCYPLSAVLDAGIPMALSSDGPVVRDLDPFAGMRAATERRHGEGAQDVIAPDQALSFEESLRAYTTGGAFAAGVEDDLGTLTPGKRADFMILSEDPFAVRCDELTRVRVLETFVEGKRVYRSAGG